MMIEEVCRETTHDSARNSESVVPETTARVSYRFSIDSNKYTETITVVNHVGEAHVVCIEQVSVFQ